MSAIRIHPAPLSGEVQVPGDKSIAHRALIVAALTGAATRVDGLPAGADVAATAAALRTMGVRVEVHGTTAEVEGHPGEPGDVLDCGNSGTTLRLLAGVAAAIDGLTVLTGDASLRRRPVDRVVGPLRAMGATATARGGDRWPPLVIRGGALRETTIRSPVPSAQVKSCVLLAALGAGCPVEVRSPAPSRDHTERLLRHLGVEVAVDTSDGERVTLTPGRLGAPGTLHVPGDPSSAAFWWVSAAVAGTTVRTPGVCVNPRRTGALEVLRALGARVAVEQVRTVDGEPVGEVTVSGPLDPAAGPVHVSGPLVVDAIDELPVLAVAGAVGGGLVVTEAAELRVKESDRVATLAAALGAVGLHIEPATDGFRVPGGQRPKGGTVDPGGDHRIAMTAAVAGTVATDPVDITDFSPVGTSYPEFLTHLVLLGGRYEQLEPRRWS